MKSYSFYFFIFLFFLVSSNAIAQTLNNGKVQGKVIDAQSKRYVDYATVSATSFGEASVVYGVLTDSSGFFSLEGMKYGRYVLEVSFIGYATRKDTFTLTPANPFLNLGVKSLGGGAVETVTAEVTSERARLQLNIDKKVFEVGKNAIVQGGTGLDVLKQVPTLNVDVDGSISLRGSENVVIYINGRPSSMTAQNRGQILAQIPAGSIDRIELITNPSAKFDAEGTSGIINIITNQRIKEAGSSTITVGYGTMEKSNFSLANNFNLNKFSFSTNVGVRYTPTWFNGYNNRTNYNALGAFDNSIFVTSEGTNRPLSGSLNGNINYLINEKNTLSLSYLGTYQTNTYKDLQSYQNTYSNPNTVLKYDRRGVEDKISWNTDANLVWKRTVKGKYDLTTSASVSKTIQDNKGVYKNTYSATEQRKFINDINSYEDYLIGTAQIDYERTLFSKFKAETGTKLSYRVFDNTLAADSFSNALNNYVPDNTITNNFNYKEVIPAAYVNVSGPVKDWFKIQVGLRAELTYVQGDQKVNTQSFSKDYLQFFPSVFISKQLKNKLELQLGYSRRINRPTSEHLNPFARYTDPSNLYLGNPNINPEYIDVLEFNVQKSWSEHSLITTAYFRQVNNYIQRFRSIDTVNGANISKVSYANLDYSRNYGLEVVLRDNWTKWFNTTANFNIFRNEISGSISEVSNNLAANSINVTARFQGNLKLSKLSEFQTSFNFIGPNRFPQGSWSGFWSLDFGYRLLLLDKRATLSVSLTDILNVREMIIDVFNLPGTAPVFDGQVKRKRESQILNVSFSYRFGKQTTPNPNNQTKRRDTENFDGGGGM